MGIASLAKLASYGSRGALWLALGDHGAEDPPVARCSGYAESSPEPLRSELA